MWHHIKSFAKVHDDNIGLLLFVERHSKVMRRQYELGLARSISAKAMLLVGQNIMRVKMAHDIRMNMDYGMNNMFHNLTTYRRQGNRSIVGRLRAVPFLEDWRDVSASPIIRQTACFKRTSKDGRLVSAGAISAAPIRIRDGRAYVWSSRLVTSGSAKSFSTPSGLMATIMATISTGNLMVIKLKINFERETRNLDHFLGLI